jgi:hypothetical protein
MRAGAVVQGTQDKRRNPPAPLPGTGAALTSVLTEKGPAAKSRGALRTSPGQTLDTVPQAFVRSSSMPLLRSYGSVVGPVGGAPVGPSASNCGCR